MSSQLIGMQNSPIGHFIKSYWFKFMHQLGLLGAVFSSVIPGQCLIIIDDSKQQAIVSLKKHLDKRERAG